MIYETLTYNQLQATGLEEKVSIAIKQLSEGNFVAAEARKMKNSGFWRARLDDTNRLLFKFGSFDNKKVILVLEVIRNHDYDSSRFLNGASCTESDFQPAVPQVDKSTEDDIVKYINTRTSRFHMLDRVLSFDDEQEAIYSLPPPVIIIGSAGSGKTALLLEKMKELPGSILYVTLSPFLAENARALFYGNNYKTDEREIDFLSFAELLQTLHSPDGREVNWRLFRDWYNRHRQSFGIKDSRMVYEEIQGVINGSAEKPLTSEEYNSLGIKQSIFSSEDRLKIYRIYESYRNFLTEEKLWDANIVAGEYSATVNPSYDSLVIDEVQDFTTPQIALCMKMLRDKSSFVLSGDANQIVHPNFFSWSRVKSYFYLKQVEHDFVNILKRNFRNSNAVINIANRLLRIKQKRFGSIDRESNFLIDGMRPDSGKVIFLVDSEKILSEINVKTGRSTKYAILALTDEMRDSAKKLFRTPLVFSIHEAKGLEYEHVVLYNMVSSSEKEFRVITDGVAKEDLQGDLQYSRGKNKEDKSGEAYKFFCNALYVALTRSMDSLYIIESRPRQPIYELLELGVAQENALFDGNESSIMEWQKEAHRLEQQGKTEQAEEIRSRILQTIPVPWDVMNDSKFNILMEKAVIKNGDKKAQRAAFEYAIAHNRLYAIKKLAVAGYSFAQNPQDGLRYVADKCCQDYKLYSAAKMHDLVTRHGIEHLSQLGDTPLQCAVRTGNTNAIRELIALGAKPSNTGSGGRNALSIAMSHAFANKDFAKRDFPGILELLVPSTFNVRFMSKMKKIEMHQIEHTLILFIISKWESIMRDALEENHYLSLNASLLTEFVGYFPESIVPRHRKVRTYLSSVLAKNEVLRPRTWNRNILLRVRNGQYMPNPLLEIQDGEKWLNIYEYCNIDKEMINDAARRNFILFLDQHRMRIKEVLLRKETQDDKVHF